MPAALAGAVGSSQLSLLHFPRVATLARLQELWVQGILGCAATRCPGSAPGTALLQEQELWRAGGQGPGEGGCMSAAEQPGPEGGNAASFRGAWQGHLALAQ